MLFPGEDAGLLKRRGAPTFFFAWILYTAVILMKVIDPAYRSAYRYSIYSYRSALI